MRPQIPDSLEEQIESVAERGGYSSGSELVRDAVRRRVDELKSYPSDRAVKVWLEREKRIELISRDTYPAVEYDQKTDETTTIEDATWTILLRSSNVPVWVHGGLQSDPIKVTCPVLKRVFSSVDDSVLLEGPGYLAGLSSENRPIDTVSDADAVQLVKQFSRDELSRGELVNAILGMAGTVDMAVEGKPTFREILGGWDDR